MNTAKPNILFILSDDQGWGDVHYNGNNMIDTPEIDDIAHSGVILDRHIVNPVCSPTRASLLSGKYALRAGCLSCDDDSDFINRENLTIADVFKKNGYATGCFGKWHNGSIYPNHPNAKGFDEFFGFNAGMVMDNYDVEVDHNGNMENTEGYFPDVITERAMEFIQENHKSNTPFFCYVPYNLPHIPYQAPRKFFNKHRIRGLDDYTASVYAMCENVDWNVGRLKKSLKELDIYNETIIVYMSDNGPAPVYQWEENYPDHPKRYNGILYGRKAQCYEGGVRVPCCISYPKEIEPGRVVKKMTADFDMLPTLAEMAGIEMAKEVFSLDGSNIIPLIKDEGQWPERQICSYWRDAKMASIRTERYTLMVELEDFEYREETALKYKKLREPKLNGRVELYDTFIDEGQKNDISNQEPDIVKELKESFLSWFNEVKDNVKEPSFVFEVGHDGQRSVELKTPICKQIDKEIYYVQTYLPLSWAGGWDDSNSYMTWDVNVIRSGRYEVSMKYICDWDDTGSIVCVETERESIEAEIVEGFDYDLDESNELVYRCTIPFNIEWKQLVFGEIDLAEGKQKISLKAIKKAGRLVADVFSITLKKLD